MEENKPQTSITAAAVASTSTSAVPRVTPIPQPPVTSTNAGARVQAALPLPPAPSQASTSSNPRKDAQTVVNEARQRFSVELKPDETTIVSWKKLVKESGTARSPRPESRAEHPVDLGPQPGLSASLKPGENDPKEAVPPLTRFSSVIEKIERLYMGKNSSDEEEELDDAPDDDQYDTEDSFIDDTELDEYFQADNLVTKHTGYFINKGQLEQIEPSASKSPTPKKRRRKDPTITTRVYNEQEWKQLQLMNTAAVPGEYRPKAVNNKSSLSSGAQKRSIDKSSKETVLALESRKLVGNSKGLVIESNNSISSSTREKDISGYIEMNPRKILNGENEGKIKKENKSEFVEPSTSGSVYPVQAMYQTPPMVRDGTSSRPKGSRLERAIKDLEKIVAECRPQSAEVQEVDPANPAIKRRLPQDVKVKLAKVARLSAGQANISEEQLVDRLMGIVGHLVQRKTLKRNMREMVELGLCAKQEKADRFQHVKKEINEMVKLRVSQLKSKMQEQQQANGSGDDFQEVGYSGALKGKFTMDNALEDKICDLYDLYVEGMDEDKGPQCRKLYVELAELWPHGYMDNLGIKEAISRSKERKRALYNHQKVRNEERLKKKKLAQQALSPHANPTQVQQSTSSLAIVSQEKQIASVNPNMSINPSSGGKSIVDPTSFFPDYYQHQGPKKMKRKAESDPGEGQINRKPVRSKEKLHKLNRHSNIKSEANAVTDKSTSTNDNPKSDGQGSSLVSMGVGLPGSSDQANVLPKDDLPNAS
ncbi:ubinuclein-1-like isoform X2 [Carex rostrata]